MDNTNEIYEKFNTKLHKKRGPANRVRMLVEKLIIDGTLSDKEMVAEVLKQLPGANTSVKCIQWYRCMMRRVDKIPQAPAKEPRPKKQITMYEVIALSDNKPIKEGTYISSKLIKLCQEYLVRTGSPKQVAKDAIYSVPTCQRFLDGYGYEVVEVLVDE